MQTPHETCSFVACLIEPVANMQRPQPAKRFNKFCFLLGHRRKSGFEEAPTFWVLLLFSGRQSRLPSRLRADGCGTLWHGSTLERDCHRYLRPRSSPTLRARQAHYSGKRFLQLTEAEAPPQHRSLEAGQERITHWLFLSVRTNVSAETSIVPTLPKQGDHRRNAAVPLIV